MVGSLVGFRPPGFRALGFGIWPLLVSPSSPRCSHLSSRWEPVYVWLYATDRGPSVRPKKVKCHPLGPRVMVKTRCYTGQPVWVREHGY